MRLPLRHPPPRRDARSQRCAYLETLADFAIGVPLGPVAEILLADAGRGRHGNALQWHLGLKARDGVASPDWEDRIEIKLVSVWSRADGALTCDKLKVCDINVDPWQKLANVLWVFADRMTRVVLGHRFSNLSGAARTRLEASWEGDPHFSRPDLFVEARESATSIQPAYYISAAWLIEEGLDVATRPLVFDQQSWAKQRAKNSHRRLIVATSDETQCRCPHCGGALHWQRDELNRLGWTAAIHPEFRGMACDTIDSLVIAAERIPQPLACTRDEQSRALAGLLRYENLWRLADRVAEPDDHLH